MSELIMIYGASNASKTTTCGIFHEHEWLKPREGNKEPGIHITLDSTSTPMQDQIDQGMVKVWNLTYETPEQTGANLLHCLHGLSQGWVPQDLDPTGRRTSNRWHKPKCSVSFEGLKMVSNALLQYFAKERQLSTTVFVETSGQKVGNVQLQVYNLVRTELESLLTRMKGIATFPRILWTSHEGVGTDAQGVAFCGPDAIPSKGLDKWPPIFAHCFHVESVTLPATETSGPEIAKLFHFSAHQDSRNAIWPAKVSLTPRKFAQLQAGAHTLSKGLTSTALLAKINSKGEIVGGFKTFLQFLDMIKQGD